MQFFIVGPEESSIYMAISPSFLSMLQQDWTPSSKTTTPVREKSELTVTASTVSAE